MKFASLSCSYGGENDISLYIAARVRLETEASINMQLLENVGIFKLPVHVSFQDAGKGAEQQITFRLTSKIAEVMEGGK